MNGRQCLMYAEHDHRQPRCAKHEARQGAALVDGCSRSLADPLGEDAAQGLQDEEGGKTCDEKHEQRREEEVEHLWHMAVQLLFEPCREGRDEEDGDDAAAPRHEGETI